MEPLHDKAEKTGGSSITMMEEVVRVTNFPTLGRFHKELSLILVPEESWTLFLT
jgi:hypothetical protein